MTIYGGPEIVTDGLVLHLDAANTKSYSGSGTAWNDLSGNGNNGTLTNGPTYSSNNKGSIIFDGTNDYVDCGNNASLNITSSITTESWVYFNSLTNSSDMNLLSKYSNAGGSSNQAWILFMSTANYTSYGPNNTGPNQNEFAWLATSNGSFNGALIGTGEQVLLNKWYQVIGIFNSVNNSMQLYINGILKRDVTRTNQTTGVLATGSRTVKFGGTPLDTNRWINGIIPMVRIYNRALPATEILQNYNALKGRFGL